MELGLMIEGKEGVSWPQWVVLARRYERELTYTTREYRDLLLSYSGHRALAPETREGLLGCIGELIDRRFGGRIAKRYMIELTVAARRACG